MYLAEGATHDMQLEVPKPRTRRSKKDMQKDCRLAPIDRRVRPGSKRPGGKSGRREGSKRSSPDSSDVGEDGDQLQWLQMTAG